MWPRYIEDTFMLRNSWGKKSTLHYHREKWERTELKYRSERIGKDKLYTTRTVRIRVASFWRFLETLLPDHSVAPLNLILVFLYYTYAKNLPWFSSWRRTQNLKRCMEILFCKYFNTIMKRSEHRLASKVLKALLKKLLPNYSHPWTSHLSPFIPTPLSDACFPTP